MSGQLLRAALRGSKVSVRCVSTTAARSQTVTLDKETRDRAHPKLGNRDIVGYGVNGTAGYQDRRDFPMPAIRFGGNTSEVMALREKEKGDWNKLSLEEKKALYRASFCQTFSEMKAPTGQWKSILAGFIFLLSSTCWAFLWMKKYVYPPMPRTITHEWQEASVQRMIDQGQGRIYGISSKFDYETGKFK